MMKRLMLASSLVMGFIVWVPLFAVLLEGEKCRFRAKALSSDQKYHNYLKFN
jgi:hypothetical protein